MKSKENNRPMFCDCSPPVVSLALLLGCLALAPGPLRAAIFIDLPEITLLPNTAGQSLDVYVQNSGAPVQVTGIGLNIQVADGGPAAGGRISGPSIASVDIFTDTVFESNNNGLSGTGSIVPQVYERGTLTLSGTVSLPNGLSKIATVTLDTTAFSSGTFALTLDTLNGPTKYTTSDNDLFPTLIDGSVTVTGAAVPDDLPGVWVFATVVTLLVLAGRPKAWVNRPSKVGSSSE
jgi:hypothetical protein